VVPAHAHHAIQIVIALHGTAAICGSDGQWQEARGLVSLEQAADKACLSSTRFAHLFKEQVGLPFSRYMLWRKLTRAMVAVASEGTIAAAAHAADFADAAHLTRTFYQMVVWRPRS
jgi:AraC-like DNA-binding protein